LTPKTFMCAMCGSCCTKSPISILPHEEVVLRTLAEKLGLPYKSTPGYRVFDKARQAYIALSYAMELFNGKCPFLTEDSKCMIQYIYKPLICRSFPYVPRHVRYNIVWSAKLIYPTVEYAVSLECPVIKKNSSYIETLYKLGYRYLWSYFKREFTAAEEMESVRQTLLLMLSELWRRGVVEIGENPQTRAPVINLYELLREYYPDLPYMLSINTVLKNIERVVESGSECLMKPSS